MEFPHKPTSSDSSTDAGHSSSDCDPRDNRFYSRSLLRRHTSSSSSSSSSSAISDSESDESSGPAHVPIHSYDKLLVQNCTPAKHSLKTAMNAQAKRPREEDGEKAVLEPPTKKKLVTKKAEAGKKSQFQQVSQKPNVGSEENLPSKDFKKRITAGSPPAEDCRFPIVGEAVGTSCGKILPNKSAKKAQHVWSAQDEIALVNGLLAFSKGGLVELPKNMAQVYERVKHLLSYDYSNVQLYDKMRRMKSKFQTINDKLKENSGSFSFKSPHDATMFQLWKQLWTQHSINAAPDLENIEENQTLQQGEILGNVPETDKTKTALDGDREDSKNKEKQEELPDDRDEVPSDKIPISNTLPTASGGSNMLSDESRALVVEVRNALQEMMENAQSKSLLNGRATTSIRGNYVSPVFVQGMKAERLEQKWREQQILEMEVFSKRLDLLQEECKMWLEELKATANAAAS